MNRRKIYVTEPDLRRLCNVVAMELALEERDKVGTPA